MDWQNNQPAILAEKFFSFARRRPQYWNASLVFIFMIAGAVLRLHHIGLRPFWLDEANSANLTGFGWSELYGRIILTGNSFAYIYILKAWALFFGDSEAAMRSLSAAAGIASIPAIYLLARRLFNSSAALLAAFLLSVNYYSVFYAIQARPYSLIILTSIISCFYFAKLLESSGFTGQAAAGVTSWKRDALIYIVVTAANSYFHPWCFLLLAAQMLFVFFPGVEKKARLIGCQLIVIILTLPWLKILYFLTSRHYSSFIKSSSFAPYDTANIFMYNSSYLFLLFSLLAAAKYFFKKVEVGDEVRVIIKDRPFKNFSRYNFLALYILLVPLALAFIIDLFVPFYQAGRYEAPALAGFILLFASFWSSYKNKIITPALCLALFFSSLGAVTAESAQVKDLKINDRTAAADLITKMQGGDLVIFTGLSRPSFDYYLNRYKSGKAFQKISFPAELESHPAFADEKQLSANSSELDSELGKLISKIKSAGVKKVWLIYSGGKTADLILGRLEKEFGSAEAFKTAEADYGGNLYTLNLHFHSILTFNIGQYMLN